MTRDGDAHAPEIARLTAADREALVGFVNALPGLSLPRQELVAHVEQIVAAHVATARADERERIMAVLPRVTARRTDWGVRDDATGNVGTVLAYNRAATEKWLGELTDPSTLMRRERVIYDDVVTDWVEVEQPGNTPGMTCPCEPETNEGCEARRGGTPELCAADSTPVSAGVPCCYGDPRDPGEQHHRDCTLRRP